MPIVSLTVMLFLLCVCQVNLTILKDVVVLTANPQGAKAIPFIQVWGLLPCAFLMTTLFTKLRDTFGRKNASFLIVGFFLSFFLLFAFVLFPNEEVLKLSKLAFFLDLSLPKSFKPLVSIIEHWPLTLYYVMSDLWMCMILGLFFWGFVNEHTRPKQAKKYYGYLQFGGTISAYFAGTIGNFLIQEVYDPKIPFGSTAWEQTLCKVTLMIVFLGLISLGLYHRVYGKMAKAEVKSERSKDLSIREGMTAVFKSPYLMAMFMLVLGYTLVYSTSDLLWKSKLREIYPDPNDIMRLTNGIMQIVGAISIVATLFIPYLVRRYGITFLALITPVVFLPTSVILFGCYIWGDQIVEWFQFDFPAHNLVIYSGAVMVCFGKAAKFSVFDVSKEMAYTPLDPEDKWHAKAAIDGVGKSMGITSSNLTHQAFLLSFGSIAVCAPYFAAFVFFMLFAWMVAAVRIGRGFHAMSEEQFESEDVTEVAVAVE